MIGIEGFEIFFLGKNPERPQNRYAWAEIREN